MPRLIIGSLVAAVAMFMLGFVFYGSPLMTLGWVEAPAETQLAIQSALKALPVSGTYSIPSGATPALTAAYAAGPVAQVKYTAGGFAMADPGVFGGGFVHMAVSVFVLGCVLLTAGAARFATRARLVIGISALAVVYIHLSGPVWYHIDWRNAFYLTVADFVILAAGGLILARWFVRSAE